MFHNTLMTFANKLQLVLSHGSHRSHRSHIPMIRTYSMQFQATQHLWTALHSDRIKPQPCSPNWLCPATLMWHCWQIPVDPKWQQSPLSLPQDFQDFRNFSSMLKLGCRQIPTLPLVLPPHHSLPNFRVFRTSESGTHQYPTLFPFIVIFSAFCSSRTLPSCVSYSCKHCLPVFLPHFRYPRLYTLRIPITPGS